jgi:hypothetical protein
MICNSKQGHYSNRKIWEMMTSKEIPYNPAASNILSVVDLGLNKIFPVAFFIVDLCRIIWASLLLFSFSI